MNQPANAARLRLMTTVLPLYCQPLGHQTTADDDVDHKAAFSGSNHAISNFPHFEAANISCETAWIMNS
jgi:hypothetical protein